MNWKKIAKQFPINKSYIWLNSAGISTQSKEVHQNFNKNLKLFYKDSYLNNTIHYLKVKNSIKKILAKWLNCLTDEVTLIHNTAEGMNFIAQGLNFQKGEILLLENEYPSNVYPWEKKYKITFIKPNIDSNLFIENLKQLITANTKIISFSAVHWITGIVLPLEEIGTICAKKNILFVVDASQGLGHIPIDVKKNHIDFLVSSCWKWLLGPIGLGVFYISKKRINQLEVIFKGTSSVIKEEEYLPYKNTLKNNADKFIISTPSYFDWVYFMYTLKYLDSIGIHKIQKRICDLSLFFIKQLKQLGFIILIKDSSYIGGIISISHNNEDTASLFKILLKNNIICTIRENKIRFSVHIMNTKKQIKKVIKVLKLILYKP